MINHNYIRNCLREHRLLIGFSFIFVGLFQYLIIDLLVSLNFVSIVTNLIKQLPPQIQKFISEGFFAQFSLQGAMAFGYTHPLVLIVLSMVAIQIPAKRISGEIESGAMEIFAALPVKRTELALNLILFSTIALFVIAMATIAGSVIGFMIYPDSRVVSLSKFVFTAVNLWALMVCISSFSMMISSWFNEGGKTAMVSASIIILFYFLDYFVKLSDSLQFLKPFILFSYYNAVKTITESNGVILNIFILLILSLVFYTIGVIRFKKRDIPG